MSQLSSSVSTALASIGSIVAQEGVSEASIEATADSPTMMVEVYSSNDLATDSGARAEEDDSAPCEAEGIAERILVGAAFLLIGFAVLVWRLHKKSNIKHHDPASRQLCKLLYLS